METHPTVSWGHRKTHSAVVLGHWLLGKKAVINLDSVLKKQRHHFADKGPYSQSHGFSSSHVWM